MYKMNDKAYKINMGHAGISRGVGGVEGKTGDHDGNHYALEK